MRRIGALVANTNPVDAVLTASDKNDILQQRRRALATELYNQQLNLASAKACEEAETVEDLKKTIENILTAISIHDQEIESLGITDSGDSATDVVDSTHEH